MTKQITTKIIISAKQREVWTVLTDFDSYPAWNPFIYRIEGRCEVGALLRITLRKSSGKLYTFMATLTMYEPQRLLQWKGTLAGMAWLFNGVHIAPKIKTLLLPTNQERIVSG
jgi:hypothetical protein